MERKKVDKQTGKVVWIKSEFNAHLERKMWGQNGINGVSTDRRHIGGRLFAITKRDLSTCFKYKHPLMFIWLL